MCVLYRRMCTEESRFFMRSFKGGEHYVEIVHVDEWWNKKMSLHPHPMCVLLVKRRKGIGLNSREGGVGKRRPLSIKMKEN